MDTFHSIYFTSELKIGALSGITYLALKASSHRQVMEGKSPVFLPPRAEAESLAPG